MGAVYVGGVGVAVVAAADQAVLGGMRVGRYRLVLGLGEVVGCR